jgi:hypothetical protein
MAFDTSSKPLSALHYFVLDSNTGGLKGIPKEHLFWIAVNTLGN